MNTLLCYYLVIFIYQITIRLTKLNVVLVTELPVKEFLQESFATITKGALLGQVLGEGAGRTSGVLG